MLNANDRMQASTRDGSRATHRNNAHARFVRRLYNSSLTVQCFIMLHNALFNWCTTRATALLGN